MHPSELEAPVSGPTAAQLHDWCSLWADLLHAYMVLHARAETKDDPAHAFIRRGLWEAAVVAYGRTANSGRRRQQIGGLLSELGPDAQQCHDDAMRWRDKHAAHRVDQSRETVEIRAVLDPAQRRVNKVGIRVSPILGPEDEDDDLAVRFPEHVKALRDLTWTQHIRPLEQKLIQECGPDVDRLLEEGKPPAGLPAKGFWIDISPSGEG